MHTGRSGAIAPQLYRFENWRSFYADVLHFHVVTKPKEARVIDRIRTFREFLSDEVKQYLGILLNSHPRFDTVEGWEDWHLAVVSVLRDRDPSLKGFTDSHLMHARTHVACLGLNAVELWSLLDAEVSRGDITSCEQRERFWSSFTPPQQSELMEVCEYFNPSDAIWNYGDESDIKGAEQALCFAVKICAAPENDAARYRNFKFWKRFYCTSVFLTIVLFLMAVTVFVAAAPGVPHRYARVPLASGAITMIVSACTGTKYMRERRRLKLENLASQECYELKA